MEVEVGEGLSQTTILPLLSCWRWKWEGGQGEEDCLPPCHCLLTGDVPILLRHPSVDKPPEDCVPIQKWKDSWGVAVLPAASPVAASGTYLHPGEFWVEWGGEPHVYVLPPVMEWEVGCLPGQQLYCTCLWLVLLHLHLWDKCTNYCLGKLTGRPVEVSGAPMPCAVLPVAVVCVCV